MRRSIVGFLFFFFSKFCCPISCVSTDSFREIRKRYDYWPVAEPVFLSLEIYPIWKTWSKPMCRVIPVNLLPNNFVVVILFFVFWRKLQKTSLFVDIAIRQQEGNDCIKCLQRIEIFLKLIA